MTKTAQLAVLFMFQAIFFAFLVRVWFALTEFDVWTNIAAILFFVKVSDHINTMGRPR